MFNAVCQVYNPCFILPNFVYHVDYKPHKEQLINWQRNVHIVGLH